MKVTFCTYDDRLGVGGPNPWLRRLLPELQKRGIQPKVLFLTFDNGPFPTIDAIRQMGIPYAQAPNQDYTNQRILWLLHQIALDPPDIFVPNLIVAAYYAGRWVQEANIPTIGVVHSDDVFYRGIVDAFIRVPSPYQLTGVACVSRFLEEQISEAARGEVVTSWQPCGTPVPDRVTHAPTSDMRLIYVGRLVEEQKQISQVTHALCKAVRQVPNTSAALYGDGSARASVQTILNAEGKGLPVTLVGHVDSQQIQQEMLASHVLVLLSDYEGLPIALMEAMACGLVPICLHMRSGIPELVIDGVTGLLVKDRNEDFVRAVRRLREEPGLWQRLSTAARAHIEQNYSNEICAERWVKFLHQIKDTSGFAKPLAIPDKFSLPPVHPAFANFDERRRPLPTTVYRRLRRVASRWKQVLRPNR